MDRKEARNKAQALVSRMTLEEKCSQMRYDAPAIPRLGIPAYNWWNEALHGVARAGQATVFPQAIGMAAAFDPDLVGEMADVIATEGRAKFNTYSAREERGKYVITLKAKKGVKGIKEAKCFIDKVTGYPESLRIKVFIFSTTIKITDFHHGDISDDTFVFPEQLYADYTIIEHRDQ